MASLRVLRIASRFSKLFPCSSGFRKHKSFFWTSEVFQNNRSFCTSVETESTQFGRFNLDVYSNLMTTPEAAKEVKMVLMQYELAKQSNLRVPSEITENAMAELVKLPSVGTRYKYLHYLGTVELCRMSDKKKRQERRIEFMKYKEEREKQSPPEDGEYGLGKNSMLLRISKQSINKFEMTRLIRAATTELPLIVDFDFEDEMDLRQIRNTAKQVQQAYGANKQSAEPFDLCFCNVHPGSQTLECLEHYIPNLRSPSSMITLEDRDYLSLYPKKKLVYLTPNSKDVLETLESDKVYIIGGIVDTKNKKPFTLAKAKLQGIKTAKLPLDNYLIWGLGSKVLTLDQVVSILVDFKRTGDWNVALQHVPRRFLKSEEDLLKEQQTRMKKLRFPNVPVSSRKREIETRNYRQDQPQRIRTQRSLFSDS